MNYTNFEKSLNTVRVLKAYNAGEYILDAAPEIMKSQPCLLPVTVYEDDDVTCIKTSSYARTPGEGVQRINEYLRNVLPLDFSSFYTKYAEALVVTRTYPVHLWAVDKMLESLNRMRTEKPYPLRFLRFGEQWARGATQYALWQHTPGKDQWWVVSTSPSRVDDEYDVGGFSDYYKLGNSFGEWLEDWIDRDGLPDPFMELGHKGGFLDPA